jgi:hypothetical protein
MGQPAVARADQRRGVATGGDTVGEPRGDSVHVDLAQTGRIDTFACADAGVEVAQDRPGQPSGHAHGRRHGGRVAQVRERFAVQCRHQPGMQYRCGIERRDDVLRAQRLRTTGQGLHEISRAIRAAKRVGSS